MIRSFDLFDTLLMRVVGKPEALFFFLGGEAKRRGLISCSATRFAFTRIDAERQARLHATPTDQDIKLHAIYVALANTLGLENPIVSALIELEMELESEFIRQVPGCVEKLRLARANNSRIVFVSDMYLPAEFIRSLIERHGMWNEGDRLYVSSEHKLCKSSGALFELLCKQEKAQPKDIHHLGNALLPDVLAPRRLGIQAELFNEGNLNRYEKMLEQYSHATDGLASLLAGASRLGRLSVPTKTEKADAIRNVGASVAGPLLIGYVLWTLRSAMRQGISRLYFVSRDGQILLKLAQVLAPRVGYNGELNYLYGGRQAWHLPATTEISEEVLDLLFTGIGNDKYLNPGIVFRRMSLELDEQKEVLLRLGHDPSILNESLSAKLEAQMKEELRSGWLGQRVLEISAQMRKATLAYFQQQGLLNPEAWAIVDIGWWGRLQASLGKLLSSVGASPPHGFYFGLRDHPTTVEAGIYQSYFFDASAGWGMNSNVNLLIELAETFCSADHGLTTQYVEGNDGKHNPVLIEDRTPELIRWGLPLLHRSILATAEAIWLRTPDVDLDADIRPATEHVLSAFVGRPTLEEARAWAEFPFEEDQAGSVWKSITGPLGIRHAWGLFRYGKIFDHSIRWHEGAWAITPKSTKKALNFVLRVGRKLRKWRILS